MHNSIKQLYRTPVKLILFFLLTAASTALLIFGVNSWLETSKKLAETEKSFTTIGTVQQKESSTKVISEWDSSTKTYNNYNEPVYDTVLPVNLLEKKRLNYLNGPEKRPYYGALMTDYQTSQDASNANLNSGMFIAEFTPIRDCVPSEPVRVKIVKVLYGNTYGSDGFWFCDENNDNPKPMKAGKTYIAYLLVSENTHLNAQIGTTVECEPYSYPFSAQYGKDGKPMESELNTDPNLLNHNFWEEVTKDFYTTGRGRYWLNFVEDIKLRGKTIPVLPVDSFTLLPSFHKGESSTIAGREITAKEFTAGEPVCLITERFAQLNGLKIGDSVTLPLLFADYRSSPSFTYGYNGGAYIFSLINAKGELYQPFWNVNYKIVGIYRFTGNQALLSNSSEMGRDEVIIPAKSVKASDENNIVDYGPMQSGTTSFQIPNGSISEFEKSFQKLPESAFLKIEYDDNGYEQVSGNLKSTQNVAILLSVVGLLSSLAILVFLMYFFIVRQKKRTAMERSLGMSKRQCRVSLISGMMILTILGVSVGSIGSAIVGDRLSDYSESSSTAAATYSMKYSSWTQEKADVKPIAEQKSSTIPISDIAIPLLLLLFVAGLSFILVNRNLKIEPIELLSGRED